MTTQASPSVDVSRDHIFNVLQRAEASCAAAAYQEANWPPYKNGAALETLSEVRALLAALQTTFQASPSVDGRERWIDLLEMAINQADGSRVTVHRTRAKQMLNWLRASTSHPEPSGEGQERKRMETGWVIEHRNSPFYEPMYWAGNGWSTDNLRAIRFARKEDAERTAAGFDEDDPLPDEQPHRIAEHGWG